MINEEKELNKKGLCIIIALCGVIILILIYLIAGVLPPVPLDYSGGELY